jgi:AraC-like DNA-binding protein
MLENDVGNGYPVNAVLLPRRASAATDPVAVQLREFAATVGVDLPVGLTSLVPAWEALHRTGVRHPGLAFASFTHPSALNGLLTAILSNSPDVATMLDGLHRLHPLLERDRLVVRLRAASASVTLRSPDGGPVHPDTVDACFAMLCRAVRQLAGDTARASAVRLRRPVPTDRADHDAAFDTVEFGRDDDLCTFDAAALRTHIPHADATVYAMLQPYAQRRVRHRRLPWAGLVSELLAASTGAAPRLAQVARALNVSTRTLQQRLAEDGRSFSGLVDDIQRERAMALLAQPDLAVTTVATRTGFASPAAFTRAFRRWTAMTPSQYRDVERRGD